MFVSLFCNLMISCGIMLDYTSWWLILSKNALHHLDQYCLNLYACLQQIEDGEHLFWRMLIRVTNGDRLKDHE